MEKKHWYTIIICSMLTLISLAIYGFYYREYVKPKSYTIGSYKPKDYTSLEIKEHLTSDDVLFSMDLDDVSFKIDDATGTATYTYSANAVDFNGENNDYIIYVNNYMLSNLSSTAGAISGTHNIKYYDVDKSVLDTSALQLSFASYTKHLLFSLTLPSDDVGLLLRYFEVNDFVVTLALNPFTSSTSESVSKLEVNFKVDNDVISTQSVEFGACATLPDYDLTNCAWSIDGISKVNVSTYIILEDTTFILIKPLTLTLDANCANIDTSTKSLYYSEAYGTLPTLTRVGYEFDGWYTSPTSGEQVTSTTTMGTSNTIIYAHWIAMTYTLSYNANGGTGTMEDEVLTSDIPQALSTNAFTREGYVFAGWSTTPDGEVEYLNGATIVNLVTTQGDTVTLYAQWSNAYYTAHIYLMTTSGSYSSVASAYLPITSPTGNVELIDDANTLSYVIEGAFELDKITDIEGNDIISVEVAEDNSTIVRFYFKRLQHILTFDANGGVCGETTRTLRYEQAFGELPTPTRDGYTFMGWYTSPNGGTQVTKTTSMDTSDITIYAHWQAN